MHVFPYSRREGTRAAKLKHAPDKKTVKERVKILTGLGKKLSADFARSFTGKTELVCIESERDKRTGLLTGYTDRYVRVYLEGPDSLKNRLVTVKMPIPGRLDNDKII
jgi:threonylcarbamoyladenosine tRNA methylthiotransferase MtaB